MRALFGSDSDQRGLTIIELLIVSLIIATLLGIGMLSYNSMRRGYQTERIVKELYVDLTNARVRAMEKNRVHFVTFAANQYAVYDDNSPGPDGDGLLSVATDSMVLGKNINAGLPLTWPGAPAAWTSGTTQFQFNAKGVVPSELFTAGNVVRVTSNAGEYDCLILSEIKINLGKWDGAQCVSR